MSERSPRPSNGTSGPNREPTRRSEPGGHPALAGAILMIGIVVLLILLAVASL